MKELLYFSSAWCSPCKQLAPRMEKLKSEGKINYKKIDVDQDTELSAKYGVRNIPTLILVENGNVVNKLVGAQPDTAILNLYNG